MSGPEQPGQAATPPEPSPGDTTTTARELLAHGLLSLVGEDRSASEIRIRHVMEAVDANEEKRPALPFPRFSGRRLAAAAALALVGLSATLFVLMTERSAYALIQQSVAALRAAGDRRYEAWRERPEAPELTLSTLIDTREGGQLLIRHKPPRREHEVVAGIDHAGNWNIRENGDIHRGQPLRGLPLWAEVGTKSFFRDPLDVVLEEIANDYTLTHSQVQSMPEGTGSDYVHVLATRKNPGGSDAGRVEIWIDPDTHLPERIEMSQFPPPAASLAPTLPTPPRLVVIKHVAAEPFPADWFAPERWARR